MSKNDQVKQQLAEQTAKAVEAEREALVIDFDEAIREQKAQPIQVRFQGELYDLPSQAPAWLPLFINRHANDKGVVGDKHNLEMIERLLGKEFAAKILDGDNFISFELVNTAILEPVMEHWGLAIEDASGKGKPTTPGS